MKKLFALVLCVMMLVSVLPTMAFADSADYETTVAGGAFDDVRTYTKLIKDTLDNTKDSIEDAYKAVAADEVVYNTAVAMDDTLMGMFDKMWDMFTDADLDDDLGVDEDGQKAVLRAAFSTLVADEMPTLTEYADDDPIERAQDFAKAVSKAFASKKFQKGFEALATWVALNSLVDDVNDDLEDEYKDFVNYTIDSDFVADFAEYTGLVDYVTSTAADDYTDDTVNPWGMWLEAMVVDS